MSDNGHIKDTRVTRGADKRRDGDSFVLDKVIFSNVFEKDIRRVYMYKKAERIAKAIHLIAPAFADSPALLAQLDSIAVRLIESAALPRGRVREALPRELLRLVSVMSIARTTGALSAMNTEIIEAEIQHLLEELMLYEEPQVVLPETSTLSVLARRGVTETATRAPEAPRPPRAPFQVKDTPRTGLKDKMSFKPGRREALLSALRTKGPASTKELSLLIRDVSEKTIQRELTVLVSEGVVVKSGERRWTTYALPA